MRNSECRVGHTIQQVVTVVAELPEKMAAFLRDCVDDRFISKDMQYMIKRFPTSQEKGRIFGLLPVDIALNL